MVVKLWASRTGRALPPEPSFLNSASDANFCYRQSKPQVVVRQEGLGKLVIFNYLIESEPRDSAACIMASQRYAIALINTVISVSTLNKFLYIISSNEISCNRYVFVNFPNASLSFVIPCNSNENMAAARNVFLALHQDALSVFASYHRVEGDWSIQNAKGLFLGSVPTATSTEVHW
jgi:hypothetical protein